MTGTCDTFKMFSFSVMQSTFRFSNVEILAVPTTSLIYNFWQLRTVDHILVGKKGLCDERFGKSPLNQYSYRIYWGRLNLNLVVTRIINGHFWRCMSKHTKRQVKWFCFPTCGFLSCLSLQFVCYFLLSYDGQRKINFLMLRDKLRVFVSRIFRRLYSRVCRWPIDCYSCCLL